MYYFGLVTVIVVMWVCIIAYNADKFAAGAILVCSLLIGCLCGFLVECGVRLLPTKDCECYKNKTKKRR